MAAKVLGQLAPSAPGVYDDLYTVPADSETVVTSIVACRIVGFSGVFRIAVRPGGAAIADEHHVAYNAPLADSETKSFSLGITLEAADVISVYTDDANTVFSAFGFEAAV